ncbi:reticulocyte binding protein 2b, pseudogene [Plasmodium ovale wallikeri]|nr:reticulocyte binding protein 2b, pseudogene [Plasmodium ovale wallikeri]SBT56650.1 reticulocyte binding protein 2b, pseudogene [Plasmodium ovale wallikeri]
MTNSIQSNVLPSPDELKTDSMQDTLSYIDSVTERHNIISQMPPYCTLMHYYGEMKRLTDDHVEIKAKYEYVYNMGVLPLANKMKNDVSICNPTKNNLINLVKVLENPEELKNHKGQYAIKVNEYKNKWNEYQKCLLNNNASNWDTVLEIRNNVFDLIGYIDCFYNCDASVYNYYKKLYLLQINSKTLEMLNNFIKDFNKFVTNGGNILKSVQKELGDSEIIDSIKFIHEEIKLIKSRFQHHFNNSKFGSNYFKSVSAEKENAEFEIDGLRTKYVRLQIRKGIKKKVTTLHDSVYNFKNSDSIVSETKELLKRGEDVYNNNTSLVENLAQYTNSKIVGVKTEYDQKRAQLKDALNKVKQLTTSISNTHNSNTSGKNKINELMNKIIPNITPQDECKNLLDLIKIINDNKSKVSSNVNKIEDNYGKVKELKITIDTLTETIQKLQKELEELIENEKKCNTIKNEVKQKMDYITENVGRIKELISSKEALEEKMQKIEKLISEESLDLIQFSREKIQISDNIKSIIKDFYEHNLGELVENMSEFLKKHEKYMSTTYNNEEIDSVLSETNKEHEKITALKCENIPEILKKLELESNKLSNLKDKIIGGRYKNVQTDVSILFDDLKNKREDLLNRIRGYKEDKKKVEQYKDNMTQRVNKFLGDSYENDSDVFEGKNSYNEFLQSRNYIINKGNEISNDIHLLKEKIKDTEHKLRSHHDTVDILKTYTNKEYLDISTLLQKYEKEKENFKLSNKDEQEFNEDKQTVTNNMEKIQIAKYNIDTIKTLNVAKNRSGVNNSSIEDLRSKKNSLMEKVNHHMGELNDHNLIGQDVQKRLKNALDQEITDINSKLSDEYIDKLKTESEKIMNYCKLSKENFTQLNESRLEVLAENMNWKNVEDQISKLNREYQVLNIKIESLINENHSEMIKIIHEHITGESTKMFEKAENHIKSLEEIKTKLASFDTKNVVKNTNSENVTKLNQNMNETLAAINQNEDKLNDIKKKLSQYISNLNEEKSKEDKFDVKKNKLETIYKQMKDTSEELNGINVETTRKNVDQAEVEYERILISDIVAQIHDENEKAKKVMADIESSINQIQEAKVETPDETQTEITNSECNKISERSKTHSSKIQGLVENTEKKKNEAENEEKTINEIKEIKKEVIGFRESIIREHNAMQNELKEIKNVNKLLMLNTSKSVADEISKNTQNAEKLKVEALEEFKKVNNLIKEAEANLDKVINHKNKINANLTEEQIDEGVKEIEQIKEDILNKDEEMRKSFAKAEELKEKVLSEINETNRGKNRIDSLQKNGEHNESSTNEFNMKDVEENIAKCQKFFKEVDSAEKEAKESHNLYIKKKPINDIQNEFIILGIKAKSEKRKYEADKIMSEMTTEHSTIKEELRKYKQRLNSLNEKPNFGGLEGVFNNEKSSGAIVTIQSNLDRVKHELSNIEKIENDLVSISATSTESVNSLSKIPEINVGNNLEDVQKNEEKYIELLNNIKRGKELTTAEKNKLDIIRKNIDDIEQKLEEHKKNYEIGILEKINEIAKQRKSYMDTAQESLRTSMESFASLFKGFNLEEFDIQVHLQDYEKKIEEINNVFESAYEGVQGKLKEASVTSINYDKVKELRENAQKEEEILHNKEEETKKYLDDVKKKESLRLIYNMKERLYNTLQMCKEEHSKVNTAHENVQKLIEDIKKLSDENDSSDVLEQAVEQNSEIQNTVRYSYKSEAQTVLNHMVNAAKFININIVTGLQMSDLNTQAQSKETEELKFDQNTVKIIENNKESKNVIEMDVYNNMQKSYKDVLHIFKYSDEIEAKKEACDNLTHNGKDIFRRITLISELKRKLNTTKSRNSTVKNNMNETFNKSKDLNNIKCSADNSHNILEISQHEKLKALNDSFRQKTSNKENEAKLTELKTSFDQNTTSLDNLEKEIEKVNAKNDTSEDIEKKISTIDEIIKEVERLDFEIKNVDTFFNESLKIGKECDVFTYTSVKGSLNSKITNDLEIINKKKTLAQEYLTYVKNSYDSINSDITTLNKYFDAKQISNYEKTTVDEANVLSTELTKSLNELEGNIREIQNEFTEVNENAEINDLQNSVEKLKNLYSTLNNKKNSMDEIYKKINLIKLKEIKQSSTKYINITEVFNNIVTTQKEGLLKNKNNIDGVMQTLKGKETELDNADSSFLIESINKFDKIHDDIMTNIRKLQDLEVYNKIADKKVKVYLDKCSHLIERNKNLITDVNKFAMNGELIKEYKDISNDVNGDIPKAKNEINNLEEKLNTLLENIKENEKLYINNDTDDFISSILKKVEDIKEKFSNNLPIREKLFNIKGNFEYIRDIFNRIKNEYNIMEFIETMSKNVDDEIKRSAELKNIQEIKNIVGSIAKYRDETKGKLYKMKSELNSMKIKKKEMDDIFKTIFTENRNAYDSAKNFVNDSNKIIQELESYDQKMTDIVNKAERAISNLEGEIQKIQKENEEKQKQELEQQRQNELKQHEESEIDKYATEDSIDEEDSVLNASQEIPQSTRDDSQDEQSKDNYHSNARYADGKTRLAGGIIIGVSIFSFAALALSKKKEEEEKEFRVLDEEFEDSKNFSLHSKEEVIEICFNEDDASFIMNR